ncbi:MAG TPA: hypothetical protein VHM69_12760 [Rubrobacter sp.]|nr:hypothetical protein [Rubrobacter sp.]
MALEDDYRTYRDVIAAVIQISRPKVETASVGLDELEEKVRTFNPHLVICSLPATADLERVPGWVELSLDLSRPTKISIKGRHVVQSTRMGLEQLLTVISEVEQIAPKDHGP